MNPPFGTRKKGVDMDFLAMALKVDMGGGLWRVFIYVCLLDYVRLLQIASQAVYSLHKTSTRDVSPLCLGGIC